MTVDDITYDTDGILYHTFCNDAKSHNKKYVKELCREVNVERILSLGKQVDLEKSNAHLPA